MPFSNILIFRQISGENKLKRLFWFNTRKYLALPRTITSVKYQHINLDIFVEDSLAKGTKFTKFNTYQKAQLCAMPKYDLPLQSGNCIWLNSSENKDRIANSGFIL